ncbi:TetR/AcrR family transcriptional regulator C-terminal domain-containing protein [Ktedonobacter sp. SOSP1-52]|uniref:TetR/AcrR family transcriptional regulator C-terminal domain-containing protein n=1 Tax=Ktedonobacter sp. SOSP1-52 TaxID=2778366 RepID=UPI001F1E177F|nr:TetR/AcrR family transcriptional regulator C-terminal domain-containing protein [Ktedonobacter sp. SOSP1-52]
MQKVVSHPCLVGFIVGHTLLGTGTSSVTDLEPGPNGPTVWQQFPAEHYPTLHALLPEITPWNSDHEFDFGLQALFQGLFEK